MYSLQKVNEAREKLERAMGRSLREYTYPEVEDFAFRMRDVAWGEEGAPSRSLSGEEEEYILNERLMCQISFEYWLTRYCLILTSEKKIAPLVPWPSQRLLLDRIAAEEDLGAKIRMILLKSRQIGGTAISEALVAHMVFLLPFTNGLIASDHPDNSLKLYQTLDRIYGNMPPWMRPRRDWNVKGTHMRLPDLDSDVLCGAGNQKTTLGQSLNVDIVHLTEVSTWNREMCRAIDADLMPAFNSSEKHHSLIILESTGAGARGNWFHDQFQAAKAGESLFKPVFIAWYLRPGWTHPHEGIEINKETMAMAERVKRETGIDLLPDQKAWYQVTKREFEGKGELEVFYQEFPSTVEEAFQTGLRSVFPITLRSKMRDKCRTPIGIYEVNLEKKKLRPVDLESWIRSDDPSKANDKFIVWEWAKRGYMYLVGVDASYGMAGKDGAAIEVLRVGNKWSPDEQVAEFRGTCSPIDLAKVAWIIGSVYRDQATALEAQMVIEVNPGSPGLVTQLELMRMNYPNIYSWHNPTKGDGGYTSDFGWQMNARTRPILMEMGVDYLKKGDLLINSPYFIEEMASFVAVEKKNGHRKLEHAPGYHDDRIICLFMALSVAHDLDIVNMADERRRAEEQRRTPRAETRQFQEMGITWEEAVAKWEDSLVDMW